MNQTIIFTAQQYINANPTQASAISELASMADDEINDGESVEHELELMVESIEELLTSGEEECRTSMVGGGVGW